MKRLSLVVSVMLVVCVALAANSVVYVINDVFKAQAIAAGTNAVSEVCDIGGYKPEGYFSLQLQNTTGVVAYVQVEITNDDASWVVADLLVQGAYTNRIFENFSETSGPSADGVDLVGISFPLCKSARVRCYATSNSSVTVALAIQ